MEIRYERVDEEKRMIKRKGENWNKE